jgi:hypothetical protein
MYIDSSCSQCRGTRWVRYFSETTDGNLEEAFRLCPCNYEPEIAGQRGYEKLERMEAVEEGSTSQSSRRA